MIWKRTWRTGTAILILIGSLVVMWVIGVFSWIFIGIGGLFLAWDIVRSQRHRGSRRGK